VIAEDVVDLIEHERRVGNGGYRPAGCRRCGGPMHIHEYRERLLLGDPRTSTEIVIFQCARDGCGTLTRVLPAFLARHLWRAWPTVEQAVGRPDEEPPEIEIEAIPARTVRRWRTRLLASAATLIVVLGTAADSVAALRAVVQTVGLDGTRAELVATYAKTVSPAPKTGLRLATVAAVVHRLVRGVRLM